MSALAVLGPRSDLALFEADAQVADYGGELNVLLSERDLLKERIEAIAHAMDGVARRALDYFLDGCNAQKDRVRLSASELLDVPRAIAAMDASYWAKAMQLTDIYEVMPHARRDEWNSAIHEHKTPAFERSAVMTTFVDLMDRRFTFFAERVDGVFKALSRSHLTNRPEGFSTRMIIHGAWTGYGPGYGTAGVIHDLRLIIATFMGRGQPRLGTADRLVRDCMETPGQWVAFDGDAFRMRVYRGIGTAHLEVHPDMAWRLNAVLASLYPLAIPSHFREPPKRRSKAVKLMQRPLPFVVVDELLAMEAIRDGGREGPVVGVRFGYHNTDAVKSKAVRRQIEEVIEAIGGVPGDGGWKFTYPIEEVLTQIRRTGCIPDRASHQFYPTPDAVATAAVALARLEAGQRVLEPSAGLGHLADPISQAMAVPVCVEVSALHCAVLRAKGHETHEVDFLAWAKSAPRFDRIVMNPPFSEGRWQAHVEAAAGLLSPGGRLVAILPSSARGKTIAPGFKHSWGESFDNAFAGTSTSVILLALDAS